MDIGMQISISHLKTQQHGEQECREAWLGKSRGIKALCFGDLFDP